VTKRLVRWALWSPSHLGITACGLVVVLLAVALVFRPTPGDAGPSPSGSPSTVSSSGSSSTGAGSTGSPGSKAQPPSGTSTPEPSGTAGPTATAADAGEVTAPAVADEVEKTFRSFTARWLTGLGALTVPGWVDDVCRVGCTPYLREMLGTVAPSSIPDATLKVVVVDDLGEGFAIGLAQLSDGQWLRITAEWDGERWLVSGIEAA
jgi:hypothetical protein